MRGLCPLAQCVCVPHSPQIEAVMIADFQCSNKCDRRVCVLTVCVCVCAAHLTCSALVSRSFKAPKALIMLELSQCTRSRF